MTLGALLACLAWAASVTALAAAWVFALPYVGMIGVAFSVVGGTAPIRMWLYETQQLQRDAYNLGRESVHSVR